MVSPINILDFRFSPGEDEQSFPCAEESMPVSDKAFKELEKCFQQLNITVNRIHSALSVVKWISGISVALVLTFGAGFVIYCGRLAERVSHLEGKAGDPLGATLKSIGPNVAPSDLSANLGLLAAQVRVDRQLHTTAKADNVQKLSREVQRVAVEHAQTPEVWQAAAELITFRSSQSEKQLEAANSNCLNQRFDQGLDRLTGPNGAEMSVKGFSADQSRAGWRSHAETGDCVINLDQANFAETALARYFDDVRAHHPNLGFTSLTLNHAHIVYSGGPLIPLSEIVFRDCSFEFKPPTSIPPLGGRTMTTQLLTADLNHGTLELSGM